jgi:carboxymethylenebutenolidase
MSDLHKYLTEEIAIDHRDGILSRREALHRLGLLGVTAVAATSLLAACTKEPTGVAPQGSGPPAASPASSAAAPASAASSAAAPRPPLPPSLPSQAITFAGPEGRKLMGAWAAPAAKPKGGLLIIHENKGLMPHFPELAGRFAAAGWAALAIDLLSEEGGTASLGDPGNATAALGKVDPPRFVADMRAGLDEIQKRAPGVKLGAIGFCFGGGMTWRLVASKEPRLAAAAPFYGPLPDNVDFAGSKAAVLAVYAEKDERVNASRETAEAALKKAALVHEVITYPGADHAFFNDTGPRYSPAAAQEAWAKVQEWFGKYLA